MLTRNLVRHGMPEDLARQYATQAVENARKGRLVGTMAKVMQRFHAPGKKPDIPKSGGTS